MTNIIEHLVIQCFTNRHALVWIEFQRTFKKILHLRRNKFEYFTERLTFTNSKRFNVVLRALITNKIDIFWSSNDAKYDWPKYILWLQLIIDWMREIVYFFIVHIWSFGRRERIAGFSREERFSLTKVTSHGHEFAKNASYRPNINSVTILPF